MTISKALDLSHDGWSDETVEAIRSHQYNMLSSGSLDEIIKGFRAEARVQRYRGEAGALARACDSAQQAVLLGRLPAVSRELAASACLELTTCRIRRGDPVDAQVIAGFTIHPDAGIAGWTQRPLRKAILPAEYPFEAVATLLNAVAENQRGKNKYREADTCVLLLLAFSRAGHLEGADRLAFRYDAPSDAPQGLLGIRSLLARVERERRSGRIGEVLGTLKAAGARLRVTSRLGVLRRESLAIRADCLGDWCQPDGVDRLCAKAGELPLPAHLATSANASYTLQNAQNTTRWLGEAPHPGANTGTDPQTVATLLRDLAALPQRKPDRVAVMCRSLDSLAGRPGLEHGETLLLLEIGSLLAESEPEHHVAAERLLRYILVRLEFLKGAEQWLTQARVTPRQLLPDSECDQVLGLLVQGIRGLDEQRFQMPSRSHHDDWLTRREHPAIARAIELASGAGATLAADLVTFSRVAGVLVPQDDRQVPLVPVLKSRYTDDTESRPGSTGSCSPL